MKDDFTEGEWGFYEGLARATLLIVGFVLIGFGAGWLAAVGLVLVMTAKGFARRCDCGRSDR